jgi:hypothetical protein
MGPSRAAGHAAATPIAVRRGRKPMNAVPAVLAAALVFAVATAAPD